MHLIFAVVVLSHRELVQLIGEMIGRSRIRVPARINRVRGSLALAVCCCSDLTIHEAAVIVDAEVLAFEALEAAGRNMADLAAELADRTVAGGAATTTPSIITAGLGAGGGCRRVGVDRLPLPAMIRAIRRIGARLEQR